MSDDVESTGSPRSEVYRAPREAGVWHEEEPDEIPIVRLANVLLRHRWKLVGLPLAIAALIVAWVLLSPPSYTTSSSLVPQSGADGGQLAQLSGLASQFGVNVPAGQAAQSPEFYADLLVSRRLLEEAAASQYTGPVSDSAARRMAVDDGEIGGAMSESDGEATASRRDSVTSTLVELYGIRAPSRSAAISRAANRLQENVSVSASTQTGVVELSVTTPWPAVSKQVADRLIELVNRFNNRVRRSQASAQAEFVKERLQEAREELRAAEDILENFLSRNVAWQQSPELRFEHDRLQRQVDLKQQVYTSLAQRYEQARIDEVRRTPVITTVTEPEVPVGPDPDRLPLKVALGLIVGGLLGAFWAFGSEFVRDVREENKDDYREFLSLKEDAAEDVRRAGRKIRRLMSRDDSGN